MLHRKTVLSRFDRCHSATEAYKRLSSQNGKYCGECERKQEGIRRCIRTAPQNARKGCSPTEERHHAQAGGADPQSLAAPVACNGTKDEWQKKNHRTRSNQE